MGSFKIGSYSLSLIYSISSFILEGGDQVAEIICLLLIPITLFDHRKFHWQNNVKVKYKESFIRDTFILFTHIRILHQKAK